MLSFDIVLRRVASWLVVFVPVAMVAGVAAGDIVISTLAILFLLHSAATRDCRWLRLRWVQVALALWLYIAARSFFTPEMEHALTRALPWVRYILFAAALATWLLPDPLTRRRVFYSLAAATGFLVADALLQWMIGVDVFGHPVWPEGTWIRLTGPYAAPKIGIILTWMAFPVLFFALIRQDGMLRPLPQLICGAAAVLLFITIVFLSGERMALLLTGLGMALAFFLLPVPKRVLFAIAAIAVALMGALAQWQPSLVERQYRTTVEVISKLGDSPYGQIWSSAARMIQAHPVFGVGPRHFRVACPDAAYGDAETVSLRCNLHPHNMYLEWFAETGAVGGVMFVALLALLFKDVLSGYRALRGDPIYFGLLITLILRMWPLTSSTSFFVAWSAVPFWFVVGWGLALAYAKRD